MVFFTFFFTESNLFFFNEAQRESELINGNRKSS